MTDQREYRYGCNLFYGNKRIMTSALDKKGNRILGSEAGERVVNQVIKGKKPFFSTNVSLDGTRNYGYFIPVYQNGTTDQVIDRFCRNQ